MVVDTYKGYFSYGLTLNSGNKFKEIDCENLVNLSNKLRTVKEKKILPQSTHFSFVRHNFYEDNNIKKLFKKVWIEKIISYLKRVNI